MVIYTYIFSLSDSANNESKYHPQNPLRGVQETDSLRQIQTSKGTVNTASEVQLMNFLRVSMTFCTSS